LIVSAGRSGTTLLRSMLVAGGQIAIPPETWLLDKLPARFLSAQGLGWEDLSRLVISSFESHAHYHLWETNLYPAYEQAMALPKEQRSLARLIDLTYRMYAARNFPDATDWGDQSPLHTFYIPWIRAVFPQAKFLHLIRDGRDAIASMVERFGPGYLEEGTIRWMKSIECVNRFRKNPGTAQLLEIRYEDLVSHAPEMLQAISEYAGIAYSRKMLDYWKLPSTVEHKYYTGHRNLSKPVFASSVGSWKERLTPEQQSYVLNKTSALLVSLGYPV
jgi:hypothetical protein